jgi:hypothetical protein
MTRLRVCVLLALIAGGADLQPAASQSTLATVFGTATNEQQQPLSGVTVTMRRLDTGEAHSVTTDAHGRYRIVGLVPGRYDMRASLDMPLFESEITVGLNEELEIPMRLGLGAIVDVVRVSEAPIGSVPLTTLGRGFTTAEIDELPVAARDVAGGISPRRLVARTA